jgi:hypothetical protein
VALVSIISSYHRRSHVSAATRTTASGLSTDSLTASERDSPQLIARQYPSSPPASEGSAETVNPGSDSVPAPEGIPNRNLGGPQVARTEAERNLKKLEQSGPASSLLNTRASGTVESWKELAGLKGVEFSDVRCFKDGCTVTSLHHDSIAAATAGGELVQSNRFILWPGNKFRSGPLETSSGQVQFVWILYSNN